MYYVLIYAYNKFINFNNLNFIVLSNELHQYIMGNINYILKTFIFSIKMIEK